MENQTEINMLAETIGDLLYALDEDLIQGPLYASLRMACDPEISKINEYTVESIQHTVKTFIEDTEKEKDNNNVTDTMDTIFAMNDEELLITLKAIGELYRSEKKLKNLNVKDLDKEKLATINFKLNQLTDKERQLLMHCLSKMLWHDTPILEL